MLVTETQISWSFFIIIFAEFQIKTSRQGISFWAFFMRFLKYSKPEIPVKEIYKLRMQCSKLCRSVT